MGVGINQCRAVSPEGRPMRRRTPCPSPAAILSTDWAPPSSHIRAFQSCLVVKLMVGGPLMAWKSRACESSCPPRGGGGGHNNTYHSLQCVLCRPGVSIGVVVGGGGWGGREGGRGGGENNHLTTWEGEETQDSDTPQAFVSYLC